MSKVKYHPTCTKNKRIQSRTNTYRRRSQLKKYPHAPRTKSTQHEPSTKPCPTGTEDEANPRHIPRTKSTRHVPTHTGDEVNPICTHTHRGRSQPNRHRG